MKVIRQQNGILRAPWGTEWKPMNQKLCRQKISLEKFRWTKSTWICGHLTLYYKKYKNSWGLREKLPEGNMDLKNRMSSIRNGKYFWKAKIIIELQGCNIDAKYITKYIKDRKQVYLYFRYTMLSVFYIFSDERRFHTIIHEENTYHIYVVQIPNN